MPVIQISNKFLPLFEILEGRHPQVDTIIETGGRISGKSFTTAIFTLTALVDYSWSTLYARFTNISIEDSIKQELTGKIDLLGVSGRVTDQLNKICLNGTSDRISFKGIKTGSLNQTASLKSLSGYNCFVVDEAEEIPNYETFKKVYYSIRAVDKRNISILILNPQTKQHWIYQKYFLDKAPDGFCGIVDNVMYIHTSYLDVDPKFVPENIRRDYERLKIENEVKYNNIVLGGWVTDPEGVLIPLSRLHWLDFSISPESISYSFAATDPANTGGDKYSMPFIQVISHEDSIIFYVADVIHNTMGIIANTGRIPQKVSDNMTSDIWIETNGLGVAAYLEMQRAIKNVSIKAYNESGRKDEDVFGNYEFIQKYFYFSRQKYNEDKEYRSFISDLTEYVKDGDNKHRKDAIDVLSRTSKRLKIKYRNILFK